MDFNIKDEEFKRRNHLLEQFADNGIEKAISQDEFNAKYGEGHQVFTMEGINNYIAAKTAEGATDEVVKGIEDELTTLSKVVVKTDNGFESRFVRTTPADLEKGEGAGEGAEESAEASEEASEEDGVEKGEADSEEDGYVDLGHGSELEKALTNDSEEEG